MERENKSPLLLDAAQAGFKDCNYLLHIILYYIITVHYKKMCNNNVINGIE